MKKIQILRGAFAKKPNLEDGQMYLAKDTKQVFVGDKAITEGEIELASKGDLNNYLPLSGGTLTGNIKVEPNDGTFRIFRQDGNEVIVLQIQESTCMLGIARIADLGAYIHLSATESEGSIVLRQYTKNEDGAQISLSENKAEIYTSNGGLYTPTSEASLVNKVYVDNAISAISSVNIEVSETQPTNQKTGDFWYQVTGTV
jgi:hypothetical protein